MKQGVLYLSTGSRGHLIRNSIGSLLAHNPDLPFHVVADRPYDAPFTWVDPAPGLISRQLKTRINHYSPFDVTLFLDDDTYVADALNPRKMLGDADVAMALDGMSPMGKAVQRRGTWKRRISEDEANQTLQVAGKKHPFYNSGVIVFRRNPRTVALFNAWAEEWARYRARDQFALVRALNRVKLNVRALPRRYNKGVGGRPPRRKAAIYHLFGKERSGRRAGLWNPLP